jgi:predicted metallopeptidase
MGDPTSSYAIAGIAVRVSGALKPHHHDKVETSSVGKIFNRLLKVKLFSYRTERG